MWKGCAMGAPEPMAPEKWEQLISSRLSLVCPTRALCPISLGAGDSLSGVRLGVAWLMHKFRSS